MKIIVRNKLSTPITFFHEEATKLIISEEEGFKNFKWDYDWNWETEKATPFRSEAKAKEAMISLGINLQMLEFITIP